MSLEAMSWALAQKGLENSSFRVLTNLANRHNRDTRRCDPCQNTLASDCEMSRATVNRHLSKLEAQNFIMRIQREDPVTKRPQNTVYILGLDFDRSIHVENAVSHNETRCDDVQKENKTESRVSNCDTEPCLKSDESRVSFGTDSVSHSRDTKQESNQESNHCAEIQHTQDFDLFFEKFCEVYPRIGKPALTEKALRQAIEAGASPEHILAGAKAYAEEQRGNKRQFIAMSENWLKDRRWETFEANTAQRGEPKEAGKDAEANAVRAIKSGMHALCQRISTTLAIELIRKGLVSIDEARKVDLVTLEDCRRAGVAQ